MSAHDASSRAATPGRCAVCGSPEPALDLACSSCGNGSWFVCEGQPEGERILRPLVPQMPIPLLRTLTRNLVLFPESTVVVDCVNLDHLCSAALGQLISLNRRLGENGAKLRLRNVGQPVGQVLRICKMSLIFEIEP